MCSGQQDCMCERCNEHGPVEALFAGVDHSIAVHSDGHTYAFMDGTGQRRTRELVRARDGGLRAVDRGQRGAETIQRFGPFLRAHHWVGLKLTSEGTLDDAIDVAPVAHDRRGRDPGHGVDREDGDRIVNLMRDLVTDGKTVTAAAYEVGALVGWSASTVTKLYQHAQRRRTSP